MNEKRIFSLLSQAGLDDLISAGRDFDVRYELVSFNAYGQPRFIAVYSVDGEEFDQILIKRVIKDAPQAKVLSLWPGLIAHHKKYGRGQELSIRVDDDAIMKEAQTQEGRKRIYMGAEAG